MSKLNIKGVSFGAVRGVMIAVDCASCAGFGNLWASPSDRFKSECKECDGDGWVYARISVAEFRDMLQHHPGDER